MNAAGVEQQTSTERAAQEIRYWMSSPPITITLDAQVSEALALMHEHSIRRLPVTDLDGKLCGVITEGDIRGANVLSAAGLNLRDVANALQRTTVFEIMTANPLSVSLDTPLREAAMLMLDNKIGGLPVVDAENTVVGVITENDLFEALVCYLDYAITHP